VSAAEARSGDSLRPLEILTGVPFGSEDVPDPGLPPDPRTALQDALRPALMRTPCLIGFSGGRDSSILMAVASALARREGMAPPVPVTIEFPARDTVETEWQEQVLRHLEIEDWLRIPQVGELDLVGELASAGLLRHGLLYPANAHFVVPLALAADCGSLVIGFAGDDVFGGWPWNDVAGVMAGRRRPHRGDLRRAGRFLAPALVRAESFRRDSPICALPWLRPEVRTHAGRRVARELTRCPRTWAPRMAFTARWRAWRLSVRCVAALAADQGATLTAPFMDPAFLAALGAAGGRWGWGDRTATIRALFSDVLPERVLTRRSKAEFSEPFFGEETRSFAAEWDGSTGIDPRLIDAAALKAMWSAPKPNFLSSSLLQSIWLATQGRMPERRPVRAPEGRA
jgi:asparagine synthase (glutamine-hydrolysing)